MAVRICWEVPCSISSVSIYYAPKSYIRMKSYDHLNFSRAFVVHFLASRYIMILTHAPESKFMVVWICRELPCLISSVSIYYAPKSDIRIKSYDHLNFSSAFVVQFQASPFIMGLNHTLKSKVMAFESAESFCVHIRASRYIMSLNWTSEWKVITIWISWELSLFIFERLGISWASHMHPSQNLWPFEFARASLFNFKRLNILV